MNRNNPGLETFAKYVAIETTANFEKNAKVNRSTLIGRLELDLLVYEDCFLNFTKQTSDCLNKIEALKKRISELQNL